MKFAFYMLGQITMLTRCSDGGKATVIASVTISLLTHAHHGLPIHQSTLILFVEGPEYNFCKSTHLFLISFFLEF